MATKMQRAYRLLNMNMIWRNKSETDPNVIQIDPDGDPNAIQIVCLIQNNPKISRAELAERLQISERKTRMCIEQLKKEGILIRDGSTKRGRWIVVEKI